MPVIGVIWDSSSELTFESLGLFTSGVRNAFITVAAAAVIASTTDSLHGFLVLAPKAGMFGGFSESSCRFVQIIFDHSQS